MIRVLLVLTMSLGNVAVAIGAPASRECSRLASPLEAAECHSKTGETAGLCRAATALDINEHQCNTGRQNRDECERALTYYERYLAAVASRPAAEVNAKRRRYCSLRHDKLRGWWRAHLVVNCTPKHATLTLDGARRACPFEVWTTPGVVELQLSASGFETKTRTLRAEWNETYEVELVLERESDPWAWVAIGGGAVALGAGAWAGLDWLDARDSIRDSGNTRADAKEQEDSQYLSGSVAVVGLTVGAAAVGWGLYRLLRDDNPGTDDARVEVLPAPGGVTITGGFW